VETNDEYDYKLKVFDSTQYDAQAGKQGVMTGSDIYDMNIDNLDLIEDFVELAKATQDNVIVYNNVVTPVADLQSIEDMIEKKDKTKLLVIKEKAKDYTVKFETEAPYTIEEDQSTYDTYKKKVTVVNDSVLHYTNVKSHSKIPEELVAEGIEFKLYWIIDGTKTDVTHDPQFNVEFVDTDVNGIVDQMQWIVPQLSQQQFEIVAVISLKIKSLELFQTKYSGFSSKISPKILDVITSSDPILAAKSLGLSYKDNKMPVYIYLDSPESLSSLPPGITVSASDGRIAAAQLTIDEMNQLAQLDSVVRIGTPHKRVLYGHVTGEGVSFTSANNFHSAEIGGAGVTVAIIDADFFPNDPEIAGNVISAILFDAFNFCGGSISCGATAGNSHGTAVAEIVVDMAPVVNLRLYTIATSVDFNNAVDDAIANNVDIITVSLGFPTAGGDGTTGFFRDGTSEVALKVNEAKNNGILVTISAGNSGNKHWKGPYVPSDSVNPASIGLPQWQSVLEFQPSAGGKQKACLPVTDRGSLFVASWNAWDLTNQDYDFILYNSAMTSILTGSAAFQNNDPPIEFFSGVSAGSACLVVASFSSTEDHFFHIDGVRNFIDSSFVVRAGSTGTPADATGALAVGAIDVSDDTLEVFSSSGPTDDGRLKPEICGPDGTLSHQPGLNPFFGTSASPVIESCKVTVPVFISSKNPTSVSPGLPNPKAIF